MAGQLPLGEAVAKPWAGESSQGIRFHCPGCGTAHSVTTSSGGWVWNGSLVEPTLSPSVLVQSGHYAGGAAAERGHCYCNFEERTGKKPSFKCLRCHSFVTNGYIQFLDDCSHDLQGQKVKLPPWAGRYG